MSQRPISPRKQPTSPRLILRQSNEDGVTRYSPILAGIISQQDKVISINGVKCEVKGGTEADFSYCPLCSNPFDNPPYCCVLTCGHSYCFR